MAWTKPRPFVDGEVVTAERLNASINSNEILMKEMLEKQYQPIEPPSAWKSLLAAFGVGVVSTQSLSRRRLLFPWRNK